MISIEGVTKTYDSKSPAAVKDLDLEVEDGKILCLVGLNGAGKTTTIRMASGIILPTKGRILIDGFDIVKDKIKASAKMGWIPEFPNFEPNAKPLPLMRYFAGFYDLKDPEKLIKESIKSVGLSAYLNRKLRTYSQGMKKRFSIAESLIGDPQNIMFDETLNGLDPEGVLFVRRLMLDLKKQGKAILLSSHILSEVQAVADNVAIINHGKLIKMLSRAELRTLGKEAVHLGIDNPDAKLVPLLEEFGNVRKMDGEMSITDLKLTKAEYSEIPKRLVGAGYKVSLFNPSGSSLEEYFFSLVGDTL